MALAGIVMCDFQHRIANCSHDNMPSFLSVYRSLESSRLSERTVLCNTGQRKKRDVFSQFPVQSKFLLFEVWIIVCQFS